MRGSVGRIRAKGIGIPFDAMAARTASIQGICTCFEHCPTHAGDAGPRIATAGTGSAMWAFPLRIRSEIQPG
ncbi:MAG: hypothetical protein OXB97_07770, partial [Rhodospirillales bacterium]|nr:hypothetical protein [Rhodospirillales bacterium]